MPITVEHQPAFAGVGEAAYGAGLGEYAKWASEQALRQQQVAQHAQEAQANYALRARQQVIDVQEKQNQMGLQAQQMAAQEQDRRQKMAQDAWQSQQGMGLQAMKLQMGYANEMDQSARAWTGLAQRQQSHDEDLQFKQDKQNEWLQNWQDRMANQRQIAEGSQASRDARTEALGAIASGHDYNRTYNTLLRQGFTPQDTEELDGLQQHADALGQMIDGGKLSTQDAAKSFGDIRQQALQIHSRRRTTKDMGLEPDDSPDVEDQWRKTTRWDDRLGTYLQFNGKEWKSIVEPDQMKQADFLKLRLEAIKALTTEDVNAETGKKTHNLPNDEQIQEHVDKAIEHWRQHQEKNRQNREGFHEGEGGNIDNEGVRKDFDYVAKDSGLPRVVRKASSDIKKLFDEYGYYSEMPMNQKQRFLDAIKTLGANDETGVLRADTIDWINQRINAPADYASRGSPNNVTPDQWGQVLQGQQQQAAKGFLDEKTNSVLDEIKTQRQGNVDVMNGIEGFRQTVARFGNVNRMPPDAARDFAASLDAVGEALVKKGALTERQLEELKALAQRKAQGAQPMPGQQPPQQEEPGFGNTTHVLGMRFRQ